MKKKWNPGRDIRHTAGTARRMDRWRSPVSSPECLWFSYCCCLSTLSFLSCLQDGNFPRVELCNRGLKWRVVTAVQLLTAGASFGVWNTAYKAISWRCRHALHAGVYMHSCLPTRAGKLWMILMHACVVGSRSATGEQEGGAESCTPAAPSRGGNWHFLNMKWTPAPVKPFEVAFEFQKKANVHCLQHQLYTI